MNKNQLRYYDERQLTQEQAVRRIEQVYHASYDASSGLDAWDQLLACEAVAESTPVRDDNEQIKEDTNGNVIVNGNDNGVRKLTTNLALTQSKLDAITELKSCDYRTPSIKIAVLLDHFFGDPSTKSGHWLYIAEHYTPKSINSVLAKMVELGETGFKIIKSPAAFFTHILKLRPKRKKFRSTNGARKRQVDRRVISDTEGKEQHGTVDS